jgi:hypothetical protein
MPECGRSKFRFSPGEPDFGCHAEGQPPDIIATLVVLGSGWLLRKTAENPKKPRDPRPARRNRL